MTGRDYHAWPETCLAIALLFALCLLAWVMIGPRPASGQDLGDADAIKRRLWQRAQLDAPVSAPKLGGKPTQPDHSTVPAPPDPLDDEPRDTPPPTFFGEKIDLGADAVVYVLDKSCSMRFDSRLERATQETIRSVQSLDPSLRFNVYVYAGSVQSAWPDLVPADREHKHAATVLLSALTPGGGTNTGYATSWALLRHPSCLNYLLLSDGAPSEGVNLAARLIRENNHQGATVDTFGISARGEFRAFLQRVAAESGGSYRDVP